MKNRIEKLKPLINFNKDEFIVVRILQRKKDNPNLEYSVKQLKTYSFYSWEELESQIDRIKEICDMNNARAYIRLNKQNSVDVSLRCIAEISDNLRTGNSSKNKGVWDSVSGKGGSKDWWVLDLDEEHLDFDLSFNHDIRFVNEQINIEINPKYKMDLCTDLIRRLGYEYYLRSEYRNIEKGCEFHFEPEKYGFNIVKNPSKSGMHIICKPFDTRILDKYNKELSSKGIQTIQIQKDANSILYIGNNN